MSSSRSGNRALGTATLHHVEAVALAAAILLVVTIALAVAWATAHRSGLVAASLAVAFIVALALISLSLLVPERTCRALGGAWQPTGLSCSGEWGGKDGGLFV
jgi:hypothetical protein